MTTILHIQTRRNHYKIDLIQFIKALAIITIMTACIALYIDFCRFPESYITTYKYQLKNDLTAGNAETMEYYNNNYVSNGRLLYEDRFIKQEDLKMKYEIKLARGKEVKYKIVYALSEAQNYAYNGWKVVNYRQLNY